jgi:hypothetical protein
MAPARNSTTLQRIAHASIRTACGFLWHKVCKALRVMPMNTTSPNDRIVSSAPNISIK